MYEWEVQYSETKKDGGFISCGCWTATVYAEDEDEVRAVMATNESGKAINKITRGERVDDA